MTPAPSVDPASIRSRLGVTEHDPVEIDGFGISGTVRPRDAKEMARALSELQGSGMGLLIQGGGTALERGNLPARADLVLATGAMRGIDEFDANDGVMHVQAGTPLSEVETAAAAEGWEVPLDPPGDGATVGGVLARAGTGPRELGWGPVRDCVLGLDVVLAGGVRTHCGGRVVKNVTGFDLAKLYTGSLGSLGIIDGAWLRLKPRAEVVQALHGWGRDRSRVLDGALRASRRSTSRAVAVASPAAAGQIEGDPSGAWHWWIELAGESAAVERDANALLEESPEAREVSSGLHEVRAFQGRCLEPGGLRARLDLVPTDLAKVSAALSKTTPVQLIYPGLGTLYAYSDTQGVESAERACFDTARPVAGQRPRSRVCLEALPPGAKVGRDVFSLPSGERVLLQALKQRFDPEALLNPGRGPGGL